MEFGKGRGSSAHVGDLQPCKGKSSLGQLRRVARMLRVEGVSKGSRALGLTQGILDLKT